MCAPLHARVTRAYTGADVVGMHQAGGLEAPSSSQAAEYPQVIPPAPCLPARPHYACRHACVNVRMARFKGARRWLDATASRRKKEEKRRKKE
jgi:hypothetical protein